jgi:hypothetical protein
VKRRAFERHLRSQGCFLHHSGDRHDVWVNPANGAQAPVPRHIILKRGTVRGICQRLGIATPF